ncbi:MAG: S8 family serine peptidase, partial [Planktothrix sp.]|uniref:S8 family serine peptidase n=1 Tax=Planktothrix sp. TaxID=3088171 RepID=UPI0038D484ED
MHGHGTHVAGTIAGKGNNGVGVTGVAWNAKIMPLKFLNDSGWGYLSDAILAINYATAKGVKLTNNSWGGGGYTQALYDAINTAGQQGALFIAAAGNSSQNTDTTPAYPASYDLANIISVASTTRTDGLSWFSNYGATTVDLGAPGSDIYSTLPNSSYGTLSGTSMASPHVTGAAALLWSQNPTWTAQQVKNSLMSTGDSISALNGKTVSGKRLNIYNALLAPSDTTPPTVSSFSPVDNATGVAVGANLVVNFSEAIQKGSGNIVIKKVSDNSVVETIAVTNSNVTVSGSQLTINPTNDLAQGTDYYVEIAAGAIKDIAGNNYAGITGSSTWNFKTQGTSTINGTAGADNLIGTANPDIINGLAGNDTLNGNTGADTLVGGLGNDIYVVDNTGDIATELASQGTDLIQSSVTYTLPANVEDLTLTGTTAINGTGNALANIIIGNTANNILNGSSGADQLKGGTGNDTYVVDNTGDIATELASQGTDLIQSSVTYTLPANVENLTLTGTTAINGTGNTLVNIIIGNTANNILNGSSGADQLKGGTGNDTYVVDNTGDVVTELASQGTDLIQSSVTYTLPANVEDLTLTGTTAINGTGNALANIIIGNTANNILDGSSGADQLKCGAGNDTYVVDNTGDVVTELASQGTDLIQSSVTYTLPANVEDLTLTGTT